MNIKYKDIKIVIYRKMSLTGIIDLDNIIYDYINHGKEINEHHIKFIKVHMELKDKYYEKMLYKSGELIKYVHINNLSDDEFRKLCLLKNIDIDEICKNIKINGRIKKIKTNLNSRLVYHSIDDFEKIKRRIIKIIYVVMFILHIIIYIYRK